MPVEWVHHTTALLQEYANRQISPPLFKRISINVRLNFICHLTRSIHFLVLQLNDPSQFVLGAFQLLANRDTNETDNTEPSRKLPPQLLDGYMDIDRWAKDYLRTQFQQTHVENLVSVVRLVQPI